MDKAKAQRILSALSNRSSGLGDAFKSVEAEMKRVADKIREEAQIQTVDDAKKRFKEIKDLLSGLYDTFDTLKSELNQNEKDLTQTLNAKLDLLRTTVSQLRVAGDSQVNALSVQVAILKSDIQEISQRKVKIPDFKKDIDTLRADCEKMMQEDEVEDDGETEKLQEQIDTLTKDFADLKKRTLALSSTHGGQANRNILVNNNPSTLSRYTDLNFKAGTNVTLTYVNNDTLKTTDLTVNSSGGGGGGMTWTIITADQTAAISNGYIANKGTLLTLTLPTTAATGSLVSIGGMNAGLWKVAQNANGQIHFIGKNTTVGVGGSVASTGTYDSLQLVCVVANNEWLVIGSSGNLTVV